MSLRTASIDDHWRKTFKRNYKIRVSEFEYTNLRGFGNNKLEFHGGITAICGLNGSGKTTFLNAIAELINIEDISSTSNAILKIGDPTLSGKLRVNDKEEYIELNYINGQRTVSDDIEYEKVWLDLSSQCPLMVSHFSKMKNLEEFLDSVEPIIFNDDELKELSYVVGKNYESCYIYELDDGEFPYFYVNAGGLEYGTELMGLGEVSILFIIWQMKRLSQGSIMIIDEPETYLSYQSQSGILDIMAKYSSEKSIWMIMSTHSYGMLKKIPAEHIKLLTRVGKNVQLTNHESELIYLNALGMPKQKIGVIFVEDRVARIFAETWLAKLAPQLRQKYIIQDIGSTSDILSALKFPKIDNFINIVGLFDGDQRAILSKSQVKELNWKFSFLPSSKSPEQVLEVVAKSNANELAKKIQREEYEVTILFSKLEGKDHHDWILDLGKELGFGLEYLISVLIEIYLDTQFKESDEAYKELLSSIQ